jgi:hypothetical protein
MGAIQYPSLTIIDEDDLSRLSSKILQTYLITKLPQGSTEPITIYDVKSAAELQYSARVSIYEVSELGSDFLFHVRPSSVLSAFRSS